MTANPYAAPPRMSDTRGALRANGRAFRESRDRVGAGVSFRLEFLWNLTSRDTRPTSLYVYTRKRVADERKRMRARVHARVEPYQRRKKQEGKREKERDEEEKNERNALTEKRAAHTGVKGDTRDGETCFAIPSSTGLLEM